MLFSYVIISISQVHWNYPVHDASVPTGAAHHFHNSASDTASERVVQLFKEVHNVYKEQPACSSSLSILFITAEATSVNDPTDTTDHVMVLHAHQ